MSIIDLLFGRPLASAEETEERLGATAGIPVFGLDALSSAAYGPEAAMTLLLVLGAAGIAYVVPITVSIVILLVIVYLSYRQTIAAYPQGGGSYTVAGQNLGEFAGLLAAAALMIDYVLTAAVGISAGVGALVSAVPSLEPHTLALCLIILVGMTFVNLRGTHETGVIFLMPTYLFAGTLLITIGLGIAKTIAAGGHPIAVAAPPAVQAATAGVTVFLLLRAFASGCTAMTGVEAVSNGVMAFREPVVKTAQRTLTIIIGLLLILLLGIAYLSRAYGIGATNPGVGYQSVLSQLTAAVTGRDWFYYLTIASILLVLSFSANTAFADFPRLCRLIAQDLYLPIPFAVRGRRLVYAVGISVLAMLCGALLIFFGGVTDRLIPLFAIGAFLAFTLSQAGMVVHWRKNRGPGWRTSIFINGLGAVATAGTVVVVTVTKFLSGAWITILLIPALVGLMYSIRRHYDEVAEQIGHAPPLVPPASKLPIAVVPMFSWNEVSRYGLELALGMCGEIYAVHVKGDHELQEKFLQKWKERAEDPLSKDGIPVPKLVVLESPYRDVISPIVDFVLDLQKKNEGRNIAVVVPELMEAKWYHYFLHNQRAEWLKAALLRKGNPCIVVINVPWYLRPDKPTATSPDAQPGTPGA